MESTAEIDDFLASAHVFANAFQDVVERQLLDQVGGHITASQIKLLKLVAMTDGYTLGDVAAFLEVSSPSASKAVDRMVRQSLLLRTEDPDDRRLIHLSLTILGRRLLNAYEAARIQTLETIFDGFAAEDLQRTAEFLDRISAGIIDHTEGLCLNCGAYFRENCRVRQLAGRKCFYQRHREE